MKRLIIFIFIFLFINIISALCEKGQIDINEVSVEKLDELYGIGSAKAEAIIDSRPFESVDDLIDVDGIGEITLEKIKDQGLACVGEEKDEPEKDKKKALNTTSESNAIEMEPIRLETKDIKTEDNNENLDKTKYAKYGFVIFCTLLGFLLILKKRKYKTEFDENDWRQK